MEDPIHIKRRLVTSEPVKKLIRRSRNTYLPGFKGFSLFEVWRPFMRQLKKTSIIERAAAISFNVFMAIPPTLIFVFTLVPYLPISRQFIEELFSVIRDVIPGQQNNSVIIEFLDDFLSRPRNELLSFGLLLAIFFSSNALMGLLRAFDKNYPGFVKRTGLQKRQTALKMTFIFFFLTFLCMLLLIAQGVVLKWIGIKLVWVRYLITNVRWVILLLLVLLSVSFLYRHGPSLKNKWPLITPGSVFATSLMFLATFIVSFYVNNFSNYNKLYGSISVVFVLMSLIYVNALVIIIGFELNVTITDMRRENSKELI